MNFYQAEYEEGFTTDCPRDNELSKLLQTGFKDTEKDYSCYIEVLRALGMDTGSRIIDFGCSWGYGTWQLQRAGFEMQAFEISKPRARFACEKLSMPVRNDLSLLEPGADVFFSAHVLEHVPSVQKVVALARKLLKPNGLFIAFTPNGSSAFRKKNPRAFTTGWGKVHPNVISDEFYRRIFAATPLLLASNPYDYAALQNWTKNSSVDIELSGNELMAVARC